MIGGHLRTWGWRLGVAALALATSVGCSSAVDGSAAKATPTYQPLPAATLTAAEIALPEDTWAVSSDASQILVQDDDDRWCVRPLAGGADTCLDLPEDARLGQASFSADGSQLALNEDFMTTMRGRLWVADVADGSVREVPPVDRDSAGPRATTGEAPDTTRSSSTRDSADTPRYAGSTFDPQTGLLVAIEFGIGDDRRDALVRVDAATGAPTPIALLDQRYAGQLTAGGGLVAMGVLDADYRPAGLITVRESDGAVTDVGPRLSELFDEETISYPDAVSPDGTRLLVKSIDARMQYATAPTIIDLNGSTAPTTLPGFAEDEPWTGAFSPDGAQVVVLVSGERQKEPSSLVVSDGTTTRVVEEGLRGFSPVNSELTWSTENVVTPGANRGFLRGEPVAWQLQG